METENRTNEELTATAVAELRGKLAALEEILNGYERAPSLEEIKAHFDSNMGAAWLCVFEGRARVEEDFLGAKYVRGAGARRWWPLLDGKPCPRPRIGGA